MLPRPPISTLFPYTTLFRSLCMNYVISDQALPLLETDLFTAQQVASLKPIYGKDVYDRFIAANPFRSEEHTSELQSRENLVCRLLLEKKKKKKKNKIIINTS